MSNSEKSLVLACCVSNRLWIRLSDETKCKIWLYVVATMVKQMKYVGFGSVTKIDSKICLDKKKPDPK